MSNYIPVPGVVGVDGAIPLYAPDDRFAVWAYHEIFFGQEGEKRFVPKVNDLVFNITSKVWYIVVAIDDTTFIPTLQRTSFELNSGEFTDGDLLLGVGPGTQADTYKVLVDKSVVPYKVAVENRLRYPKTEAAYIKLFKGPAPIDDSNCVSLLYDASNNLVGNRIPLVTNQTNGTDKYIPVFSTREDLKDNDVVVVVAYSEDGIPVSTRQLMVWETGFIHSYDRSIKYVTGIRLESPFISTISNSLIEIPINVPVGSLNLIGVVEYSDGSVLRLPVDNTKFEIHGFQNFVSTVPSQKFKLTLKYNFANNEVFYGGTVNGSNRFTSRTYDAIVSKYDGDYTVKLYGYPTWVSNIEGYRMEYYLYNLSRDQHTRVTSLIQIGINGVGFNPTLYGVAQDLNVAIDLNTVDPSYGDYRHTQTLTVTLHRQATADGTAWTVMFDPVQSPAYGTENQLDYEFVNQNFKRLDLSMDCTTREEWLQKLYWNSKPMYNQYSETIAPTPTHFNLIIGTASTEYTIDQWNEVVIVGTAINTGVTVYFEFFNRTAVNDLYLACGAAVAKQM